MSGTTEDERIPMKNKIQHPHASRKVEFSDFNKRVCKRFVGAKNTTGDICCCGFERSSHCTVPDASDESNTCEKSEWSVKVNTESKPTDAFGKIKFVGYRKKVSEFVRVDYETDPELLLELLKTNWELKSPNLLISVIGGAKSFEIDTRLKDEIGRGLVKAAEKAGAWIITGGMNTGVMKLVGDAIHDNIFAQGNVNSVVALGVASWGCIENKDSLVKEGGSWPAKYQATKSGDKSCSLDPNHSHYILVDNGTQHQYGGLRSRLETAIKLNGKDGRPIPAVIVVVEGGVNTLKTVASTIKSGIPAVIVQGSGRAADLLAHAYTRFEEMKKKDSSTLEKVLKEVRSNAQKAFLKEDVDKSIQYLRDCLEMKEYMTVHSLDGLYSIRDIDLSILKALIKVKKQYEFDQLLLALSWNRVGEAKSAIIHERFDHKSEKLNEYMCEALKDDKHEFVQLFIENGFNFDNFHDHEKLTRLYSELPDHCPVKKKLSQRKDKDDIQWDDVKILIEELRGASSYRLDFTDCSKGKSARDFFLWAALTGKEETAKVLWKENKEPIAAALTASMLLRNLNQKTDDSGRAKKMLSMSSTIEKWARDVLTECHATDERKCKSLLVRKMPLYGNASCIQLAIEARYKKFIAHDACQVFLRNIWMGEIEPETDSWRMWFAVIMPALLFLLIKFKNNSNRQPTSKNGQDKHRGTGEDEAAQSCHNCPGPLRKIWWFYNAPIIKFFHHSIAYIVFLILFSIVMLTDFNPDVTIKEMVLMPWVFAILLEEIRQLMARDSESFRVKLQSYISDVWNIIDVVTIVLIGTGTTLRFISQSACMECFEAARIVLVLNLITFYIRALRVVSVHRQLGPKLVMIGKMMVDLCYFLAILMIFIIAYGVATQALLYPNSPLDTSLVREVLRKAYWKMYAELFLEEVEGEVVCTHEPLLWQNNTLPRCAANTWAVPILLGVYVLITNILMLNLLIAMFSNTFNVVQEKSDVHWKFQRFSLTNDYSVAPPLAPPLIIVSHIYLLLKQCLSKDLKRKSVFAEDGKRIAVSYDWENAIVDDYWRKSSLEKLDSSDHKTDDIFNRVISINNRVDDMARRTGSTMAKIGRIENQIEHLEKMDEKIDDIKRIIAAKFDSVEESSSEDGAC